MNGSKEMSGIDVQSVKERLSAPEDYDDQFPIHYAYDYLGTISYLHLPNLHLNEYILNLRFLRMGEKSRTTILRSSNAIDITPCKAGLPWATGIMSCRQSKHWRVALDATRLFLKLIAGDESAHTIVKCGHSIAEISRLELASNLEEGWVRFPIYLFAEADSQRSRLLAILNVFIFVFDDFWEMHNIDSFTAVREEFVARMRPGGLSEMDRPASILQSMIDQAIQEILELDRKSGNNAGEDMIERMVRFFTRPPPPPRYSNMEDFLRYRHEDAAVPYVLGCTKFSLNSSVDLDSPRLARYLRLVKDHVSIANDLGSWEKEKVAYDDGKVLYLINAVDVTKELFQISDQAAVAMTEALQLQIEVEIDAEIQRMISEDLLTVEEWRFVDATVHVMSGNVFVSTVMSRYGGEAFALK